MKNAIQVATRVVALVGIAAVLSGCVTERDASRFLRKDAHFAPSIYNEKVYGAVGERLDSLEVAISVDGFHCTDVPDKERVNPNSIRCGKRDLFVGQQNRIAAIDAYVEGRNEQIDKLCDVYIHSLASMGDTSRWSRTQINAIADVGSMILGLAETPAQQLAYLAAGKSLYNQTADNLENYLLLSPSADKVAQLVGSAQSKKRADKSRLRQIDERERWTESSLWVQEYAALCTPRGIRGLLDEAIDLRSGQTSDVASKDAATLLGPGMEVSLRLLAKDKGVDPEKWPALTDPLTLGALTWYLRESSSMTDAQKTFVAEKVGPELSTFLKTIVKDSGAMAALKTKIDTAPGRYDELVRLVKASELSHSAVERAEAAQSQAKIAVEEAVQAKAKADTAQVTINDVRRELSAANQSLSTVNQTLIATNAELAQAKADRLALQKQLDALKAAPPPQPAPGTPPGTPPGQ
jgi:hypothetical protein